MAVPAAPIPVQTAYAVPTGSVSTAFPRRTKLTISAIAVPAVGIGFENPSV
jgi:hypothetical protein